MKTRTKKILRVVKAIGTLGFGAYTLYCFSMGFVQFDMGMQNIIASFNAVGNATTIANATLSTQNLFKSAIASIYDGRAYFIWSAILFLIFGFLIKWNIKE